MNLKKTLCLFLLLAGFSSHASSLGMAAPLQEYEIKAAFLYQFGKFVDWSEPLPQESFNICVLGSPSFESIFSRLETADVKNKQVDVRMIAETSPIDSCQILFVSHSERNRLREILGKANQKRILTVGESEGFLENGGIINFIKLGNKIRFEINQKQAEASHIKISSKLMSVASRVIPS